MFYSCLWSCVITNSLLEAMFLVGDAHLKCSSVFGHFVSVYKVIEVMFLVVT